MSSRNQLHAAIIKAEMRGDTAKVAELKKQVAELEPVVPKAKASSVSLNEKNKIHARILKAELLGNTELVQQLKAKLAEQEAASSADPVSEPEGSAEKVQTVHVAKRIDEEQLSVKQLYKREKAISSFKDSVMFVSSSLKTMDKHKFNPDDEYDVEQKDKKLKSDLVYKAEKEQDSDELCAECPAKRSRDSILCTGTKVFLSFGRNEPLLEGHCFIRSMSHQDTSLVSADEETVSEINLLKKKLVQMHQQKGRSVIFTEVVKHNSRRNDKHLVVECLPISQDLIPEARMYFRKSIQECEAEWSMNKKLVEIDGKDISRVLPKGLSYFWVTFGGENSGYAHVIEDENNFPSYFAAEVIGGILDIEPRRWRKPRTNFRCDRNAMLQTKAEWKKLDPFIGK